MAFNIGDHIELGRSELRNALIHPLTSDPASPTEGQIWYRSDLDELRLRLTSSTATIATGASIIAGAGLTLTGSTLDVGAGNGISVAADSIAVKLLTNGGLEFSGTDLAVDVDNSSIERVAGGIQIKSAGIVASHLSFDADDFFANKPPNSSVSFNSQKITNLLDPTAGTDGANKQYVDALVQGVDWISARAASTANITIPPGGTSLTVDGVTMANNDRLLLKNQTTTAQNGVYTVGGIGSSVTLTRATDMDAAGDIDGKVVIIEDGSTLAGTLWITTSEVTTLGTDAITFTQFNSAADILAGNGLTKTGNTLDTNVDNSTIEINSDTLRVKAAGISFTHLSYSALKYFTFTFEGDGSTTMWSFDTNEVISGTSTRLLGTTVDVWEILSGTLTSPTSVQKVYVGTTAWRDAGSEVQVDITFGVAPAATRDFGIRIGIPMS